MQEFRKFMYGAWRGFLVGFHLYEVNFNFQSHNYQYNEYQQSGPHKQQPATASVEEENEKITEDLKDKIGLLRTLAIDMGTEVKYHNKILGDMSTEFENTGGFLSKTMERVVRLGRSGHNYHLLVLFVFIITVFFLLWIILKFT